MWSVPTKRYTPRCRVPRTCGNPDKNRDCGRIYLDLRLHLFHRDRLQLLNQVPDDVEAALPEFSAVDVDPGLRQDTSGSIGPAGRQDLQVARLERFSFRLKLLVKGQDQQLPERVRVYVKGD